MNNILKEYEMLSDMIDEIAAKCKRDPDQMMYSWLEEITYQMYSKHFPGKTKVTVLKD